MFPAADTLRVSLKHAVGNDLEWLERTFLEKAPDAAAAHG